MQDKRYDQLRAELLERVDIEAEENAKLVSGGNHQHCPDGTTVCGPNETCCFSVYASGNGWWCCPESNADCCEGMGSFWCCPSNAECYV